MTDLPPVQFRGLSVEFVQDNLLTRHEDVLVIASDSTFSLSGGIGFVLQRTCGPSFKQSVDAEAANHGPVSVPTVICVDAPSSLYCRHVFVVPLRRSFRQRMHETFSKVFLRAISMQVTSIVMPPLGTGGFHLHITECANAIRRALEGIHYFGTLTKIVVVDRSTTHVELIRNSLVQMSVNDIISAAEVDAEGPAEASPEQPNTSNRVTSATDINAPFSMFYAYMEPTALSSLREKRLDELKENISGQQPDQALEPCPVCLVDMLDGHSDNVNGSNGVVKLNRCPHMFHRNCIIQWFSAKPQCPCCNTWYMLTQGTQPADGTMTIEIVNRGRLDGMSSVRGYIRIKYTFPDGIQQNCHPRPGVPYSGISRTCYLPYTEEGEEVADLLQLAFDRRLVFTVGDSVTTGRRNVVIWNGIHHKTSKSGGPTNHGYPDPGYLARVKQELSAVGITPELLEDTYDD